MNNTLKLLIISGLIALTAPGCPGCQRGKSRAQFDASSLLQEPVTCSSVGNDYLCHARFSGRVAYCPVDRDKTCTWSGKFVPPPLPVEREEK